MTASDIVKGLRDKGYNDAADLIEAQDRVVQEARKIYYPNPELLKSLEELYSVNKVKS